MISLYRIVPNEEHTLVVFQGDHEDIGAIAAICGFSPRRTTLYHSYEQEYYAYLRGPTRGQKEASLLDYLRRHYSGPELEMFRFRGTHPLSGSQMPGDCASSMTTRVQTFFAQRHGRICSGGGLGCRVFRAQALEVAPGLAVREGVSYRVSIANDSIPVIQTDIAFRFERDGREVTLTKLYEACADKPDAINAIHQFQLRSTDDILLMVQSFIQSLKQLGSEFEFSDRLMRAGESGWDAWLWAHELASGLVAGNGRKLTIPLDILKTRSGLYKPPGEMDVTVLYPDDPGHKMFPAVKGAQFDQELRAILDATMPDRSFRHRYLPYQLGGEAAETVQAINQLWGDSNSKHLVLMIIPPKNDQRSGSLDLQIAAQQSLRLSVELRHLRRNTYVVSCGWDTLVDEHARGYAINLAVIKGLTVLGAVPWVIDNMPHAVDYSADDLCFIGIDVNTNRAIPIAGGVVFDGQGQLCGYQVVRLATPDGDRIGAEELRHLVSGLLKHYRVVTGRTEKHVVVHRDGILELDEANELHLLLNNKVSHDLVEIRKSGAARLRQPGNLAGTPSKDVTMANERLATAILCNTLAVPESVGNHGRVFPAPDSIAVRRCEGATSIKTLAAQIYLLTQIHHAHFHRTVQLPVTTAYADALVGNCRLPREDEITFGRPINDNSQPYWL